MMCLSFSQWGFVTQQSRKDEGEDVRLSDVFNWPSFGEVSENNDYYLFRNNTMDYSDCYFIFLKKVATIRQTFKKLSFKKEI